MGVNRRQWLFNQIVAADATKDNEDILNGDLEETYWGMVGAGTLPSYNRVVYADRMVGGTDCTSALLAYLNNAKTLGIPLFIPASSNGLPYKCSSILRGWTGARILSNGATIDFQTDHSATGVGFFFGSETSSSGISDVRVKGLKAISSNASARNGVYGLFSIFNSADIQFEDYQTGTSTAGSGGESVGTFVMNSQNFRLIRPKSMSTYADGIHISRGSVNFEVDHPIIIGAQDDGVAVVSVKQDGSGPIYAPCQYGEIIQPIVRNSTVLGSGVTLIGAQDCDVIGGSVDTVPAQGFQVTQANYGGIINAARNRIIGMDIGNASSTSGCWRVGNATDTIVSSVNSYSSYSGAVIAGSANTQVVGCRVSSTGTSQYGVYDDSASSRTLVTGSILIGNSSGPYLLQGTGSVQTGNITA